MSINRAPSSQTLRLDPDPECPEIGECPTATVLERISTSRDRIHVTTHDRDRTRCGRDCKTKIARPMDPNAGESDEWVVKRLGATVEGRRMCPVCARRYLGTEPGHVSWRHRLATVSVRGKDTRHHLGGQPEVGR